DLAPRGRRHVRNSFWDSGAAGGHERFGCASPIEHNDLPARLGDCLRSCRTIRGAGSAGLIAALMSVIAAPSGFPMGDRRFHRKLGTEGLTLKKVVYWWCCLWASPARLASLISSSVLAHSLTILPPTPLVQAGLSPRKRALTASRIRRLVILHGPIDTTKGMNSSRSLCPAICMVEILACKAAAKTLLETANAKQMLHHVKCERCFGTPLGVGLIYRQGCEARQRFKRRRAAVAGARLPRSMEGARRGDCW